MGRGRDEVFPGFCRRSTGERGDESRVDVSEWWTSVQITQYYGRRTSLPKCSVNSHPLLTLRHRSSRPVVPSTETGSA